MITTSRCMFPLSLSGLSIAFALGLALWEWYFFFVAGTHPLANRLGFNLAWLTAGYLTYQLISIPFALPAAKGRFIGVVVLHQRGRRYQFHHSHDTRTRSGGSAD